MRARVFLALVIAVLLVPGVAHAKGPDLATIDGAGMAAPIAIAGVEGQDDDLAALVELAGLFPALFGQQPDPMLAAAPDEALGPKLVITWRLPDGGPSPSSIQQELYLYAEGGPLTYTAPDQPVMDGDRTTGGWFRTPPALQPGWEAFDLPARSTLEGTATAGSEPVARRIDARCRGGVVALARCRRGCGGGAVRPRRHRCSGAVEPAGAGRIDLSQDLSVEGRPLDDVDLTRRAKEGDMDAYASLVARVPTHRHPGRARDLRRAE